LPELSTITDVACSVLVSVDGAVVLLSGPKMPVKSVSKPASLMAFPVIEFWHF